MINCNMKVSERIKAIRKSRGITQVDMSEKMGVGQSNYAYLEDRGDKLTVEQLGKIAGALGVTVGELLTDEPQTVQDNERVKELEKRVSELEDRVNDKQFKIDAIERQARIFEKLVFESLADSVHFSDKLEDYVQVIENNKWLIPFLTGISYNSLKVKDINWKNYWSKAIEIVVNRINDLVETNDNPDEVLWFTGTYIKKKYKRNRDIFNDPKFDESNDEISFLWYYRPNDLPYNKAQEE